HDLRAAAGLAGPDGPQVVDAEVDRLRHAVAADEIDRRHQRGELQEGAHHAAVQRRQRGVADQIVPEGQYAHQSLWLLLETDIEETSIRDGPKSLPAPHDRSFPCS